MFAKFYTKCIEKIQSKPRPTKLNLDDYRPERIVEDDVWNKVPNSQIRIKYYDHHNKHIGSILYRLQSGQIGSFFLHDSTLYRRGLGRQMLTRAIAEIKHNNHFNPNVKEIWAVTSNHNFFSNVFDKAFSERKPAHPSVTGSGYYMEIGKCDV
jgi:hypothetical protein